MKELDSATQTATDQIPEHDSVCGTLIVKMIVLLFIDRYGHSTHCDFISGSPSPPIGLRKNDPW